MDPRRHDWIDRLRGVAILLVIADHAKLALPGWHGPLSHALALGQTGVQLFFVASALTLCLSAQARGLEGPADLRDFWLRRLFRVAPLYWTGILLYWLNGRLQGGTGSPGVPQLLANATFVHGFVPSANNNVVPGGWSIGTEMAFYLLFPLLWRMSRSLRATLALTGVALAAALAVGAWSTRDGGAVANNGFLYFNLVTQLPVFLLGMLAFQSMRSAPRMPARALGALSLLGVATGALAWTAGARLSFSAVPALFGLAYAAAALAVARIASTDAVGAAAARASRGLGAVTDSEAKTPAAVSAACVAAGRAMAALLQRIGRASFAIYVVHFIVVWELAPLLERIAPHASAHGLGFTLLFVATTAISLVLAERLGRSIEQPCIRAGGALLRRLRVRSDRDLRARGALDAVSTSEHAERPTPRAAIQPITR